MSITMPKPLSRSSRWRRNRNIKVWEATQGYCVYCNRFIPYAFRSVDHVIPRSRGGTYRHENLVPACRDCNTARADRVPASGLADQRWRALVAAKEPASFDFPP